MYRQSKVQSFQKSLSHTKLKELSTESRFENWDSLIKDMFVVQMTIPFRGDF